MKMAILFPKDAILPRTISTPFLIVAKKLSSIGQTLTSIWRSTKDINLEKDKEVIDKTIDDFEPDEVFINGDAFYPKGYKVIETEFKALMGV